MENNSTKAIVFGSGHIASRVKNLLEENGVKALEIIPEHIEHHGGIFRKGTFSLETIDFHEIRTIYIVDDNDDKNIEFLIAVSTIDGTFKVAIAIFNKMIAQHVQNLHKELLVINPAEISADVFVGGLDETVHHALSYVPPEVSASVKDFSLWGFFLKIIAVFVTIVVLNTLFFYYHNGFTLIDSLYFVIVTVSTVGYGDISLAQSDMLSKCVVIMLMLTSMVFVGLSFSFIMDELLKKRNATLFGIRKYNLKNHVIVCGLGRTSYFVIERLLAQGHKVMVVEKNKDSPLLAYFKSRGAEFYVGDAVLPKTLQDVNVRKAKALISLVNNDSKNLEIGLSARSLYPGLRLILRIYEKSISEEIKSLFDIQLTFSVSEITAEALVAKTL